MTESGGGLDTHFFDFYHVMGHHVPEGKETWEVLMNLKDVELSLSTSFTEKLVYILVCRTAEHDALFQVFLNEKLHRKHHYVEHYPQLIQTSGPLSDLWTIRFSKMLCITYTIFKTYTPYFDFQTTEDDSLPFSCRLFFQVIHWN